MEAPRLLQRVSPNMCERVCSFERTRGVPGRVVVQHMDPVCLVNVMLSPL